MKILILLMASLLSYHVSSAQCTKNLLLKDKASLSLAGENGKLMVTFRPPGAVLQFHIAELKIID
ncbi:hypothetical protein SAMN05421820_101742 [Pedobacter steynii]|uniref:Uncharacterized protein n=1 Tax=Pedobacter steynii TaxID=430522 RepID=A0A1G9L2E6_9SPHI|nr:hypothetical protein [Pedobacter steynii]NQX38711.1 hypothetical protein [Pedobacter steynii]SDL56142.1 hypothetical protein SAMN05421820_101742 [Pedobacter steynii]